MRGVARVCENQEGKCRSGRYCFNVSALEHRTIPKHPSGLAGGDLVVAPVADEMTDLIVLLELLQNIARAGRAKKPNVLGTVNSLERLVYFYLLCSGVQTLRVAEDDNRPTA